MSIPLYLIKAEIVGTSLMIWEKSSDKVTAYLKQDYSQLANPPLEKQSILMKQFFKIQNLRQGKSSYGFIDNMAVFYFRQTLK